MARSEKFVVRTGSLQTDGDLNLTTIKVNGEQHGAEKVEEF